MNNHFSLRTDGSYLKKVSDDPSYHFIWFKVLDPNNGHANNNLVMGSASGMLRQVLTSIKEENIGDAVHIPYRFDDNDDSEVYWYTEDDWHCIITVHNEGNSVIYTKTHAKHKRQSAEYVFHHFPSE